MMSMSVFADMGGWMSDLDDDVTGYRWEKGCLFR
jgi:hypothetical protein